MCRHRQRRHAKKAPADIIKQPRQRRHHGADAGGGNIRGGNPPKFEQAFQQDAILVGKAPGIGSHAQSSAQPAGCPCPAAVRPAVPVPEHPDSNGGIANVNGKQHCQPGRQNLPAIPNLAAIIDGPAAGGKPAGAAA